MDIGPQLPAHLLAEGKGSAAATEQPEAAAGAGPSTIGPVIPTLPSATIIPPTLPIPRYEEEEEEEGDEDDDGYAPELPPELAAARANPSGAPPAPPRRTMGPAWGPLRREEEEEESEEEEEVGPAPPPPPVAGSLAAREDAVMEFMQKEAQRRQAVEVRRHDIHSILVAARVCQLTHLRLCFTGGSATKDAST